MPRWCANLPDWAAPAHDGQEIVLVTNDVMLGSLYLLMAMMLVLGALINRREPLAKMAVMALAWVAIFGAGFVLFTFRDDLGFIAQRLKTEATGAPIVAGREVRIPMSIDGHFWVEGEINGAPVKFLVDSGATVTTIDRATALRAGATVADARDQMVRTGNGFIRVARGRAQTLQHRRDRTRGCRAAHRRGRRDERARHELPVDADALGRGRALADPAGLMPAICHLTFNIIHIIILADCEQDDAVDEAPRDARRRQCRTMRNQRRAGAARRDHGAAARSGARLRMGQRPDLRHHRALHDRGSL